MVLGVRKKSNLFTLSNLCVCQRWIMIFRYKPFVYARASESCESWEKCELSINRSQKEIFTCFAFLALTRWSHIWHKFAYKIWTNKFSRFYVDASFFSKMLTLIALFVCLWCEGNNFRADLNFQSREHENGNNFNLDVWKRWRKHFRIEGIDGRFFGTTWKSIFSSFFRWFDFPFRQRVSRHPEMSLN